MHQHLWHCGGDIAHIQHGEDAEEEVHGCVEVGVQVDQGDNEPIAHKCREVEEKEDIEENYIDLEVPGEAQKDELCYRAVVLQGETLHSSPTAGRHEQSGPA